VSNYMYTIAPGVWKQNLWSKLWQICRYHGGCW